MSRVATDAWYDSERIDRLKLVAVYLAINGIVALASLVAVTAEAIRDGAGAAASDRILSFIVTLAVVVVWYYSAYLLWNARRAGAYWVIALTVFSILRWFAQPWSFIELAFELIPVTLIAMSWSALKSD